MHTQRTTSMSIGPTSAPSMGIAYGLSAALIWGAWPVFSRQGLGQALDAWDITALRFTVAGVLLAPLLRRAGWRVLGGWRSVVIALGAGAPYVLLATGGLAYAPAAHAGIVTPSCMLIFATLGGWWLLGDRPSARRWVGLVVVLAGVALIGVESLLGASEAAWMGDAMFVGAGALWATYTIACRAWFPDSLHAAAVVSVYSLALFVPAYVWFGTPSLVELPVTTVAFQGLFQGVLAAAVALICYSRAVNAFGAGRGALFAAAVPGFTVLLALPVLGETPTIHQMLGVVTVTAGMVVSLYQPYRGARG